MSLCPSDGNLPVDPRSMDVFLEQVTASSLEREERPFAHPREAMQVLSRTERCRLRGKSSALEKTTRTIPSKTLSGLLGMKTLFVFCAYSDGREIEISIGTQNEHHDRLAHNVRAEIGGPEVEKPRNPSTLFHEDAIGCLYGIPGVGGHDGRQAGSAIDILLDTMGEDPFLYCVIATPEPAEQIRARLHEFRLASQQVDRVLLQTGVQANTNRTARSAVRVLEAQVKRLETANRVGIWRVSSMVFTKSPELTRGALSILVGRLRGEDEQLPNALRAGMARGAASHGGLAAHANELFSEELAALCPLPGRDRSGFAIIKDARFDVDQVASEGRATTLGSIVDGNVKTPHEFSVPLSQLVRHVVVAGNTGSGKTHTVRVLLDRLTRHGVPFMVIEPAKAEYRDMSSKREDLIVLRAGSVPIKGEIPFLFNPFHFPDGFPLHTHIDYLKSTFVASFGLYPPAPYLLETALYRVYEKRGWNIYTGEHPRRGDRLSFPTLSDLLEQVDPVVDQAEYHDEITKNLKGALKTRIGNLCLGPKGMCLNTRENIPDSILFESPTIIEIQDLGSDEEKALVMGFLITRLYEIRSKERAPADGKPKHVLIIEEAHRLLRRVAERPTEDGNMQGKAVETFVNMLAEVRAYGQGVLVAEQLPSKLSPDIVKNCCTKIVHRLGPKEDRDFVGDMMVLSPKQKDMLATLRQGEAVVHTEGMDGAIRVCVDALEDGRGRFSDDPLLRLQRSLLPETRDRFLKVVEQNNRKAFLEEETVKKAADGFLLCLSIGHDPDASFNALSDTCRSVMTLQCHSGEQLTHDKAADDLAWQAADEALLRRALFYGWPEKRHLHLQGLVGTSASSLSRELAKGLQQRAESFPHCVGCTKCCFFGYEAQVLLSRSIAREELREVLAREGDDSDFFIEAEDLVGAWLEEEFGLAGSFPRGLYACVIGHGLCLEGLRASVIKKSISTYR